MLRLKGKLRTGFVAVTLVSTLIVYSVSAYYAIKAEPMTTVVANAASLPESVPLTQAKALSAPETASDTKTDTAKTDDTKIDTAKTDDTKTDDTKTDTEKKVDTQTGFNFPDSVSTGAQKYLEEAYNQAYAACKDTVYPDPFMAMSLSVVELPVNNDEVFRIPLVNQDTLNKALKNSGGDYSAAIQYSSVAHSYGKYDCVGPLQLAPGWVNCTPRNPTVWKEACQMFYEDAELAGPGLTAFAKKCDIEVKDKLLRTLLAMRHNVGWLNDWEKTNPDSRPGQSFIPFKTKRTVFQWNAAVASDPAQDAIKKAAYNSYLNYLKTGKYENQGIGWRVIADITGYPQSNVTSDKEWWRPLYSVRFWYNYYQLRLLYGVDTAETLGIK